jgi:hypothetical protein
VLLVSVICGWLGGIRGKKSTPIIGWEVSVKSWNWKAEARSKCTTCFRYELRSSTFSLVMIIVNGFLIYQIHW